MGTSNSKIDYKINLPLVNNLLDKLQSNLVLNTNKVFHLVWIGNLELPYISELCIKSIYNHNPDYKIILHYSNPLLLNNTNIVNLVKETKLICNFITEIDKINELYIDRITARSDIIRLLVLYKYGGIYLDTDIIVIKSFNQIYEKFLTFHETKGFEILLGKELGQKNKNYVNNGVIFSIQKSSIVSLWLSLIEKFYTTGGWSEHGVVLITKLYSKYKDKIIIVDHNYFDPYPYWDMEKILNSSSDIINKNIYCIHLFNHSCKNIFKKLDDTRTNYDKNTLLSKIIMKGISNKINNLIFQYSAYDTIDIETIHFLVIGKLKNTQIKTIESVRYHNPNIKIVIHSNSSDSLSELSSELNINYNQIYPCDCYDNIKFNIIYKYGGMYLDLDMICIQSLKPCFENFNIHKEQKSILVCKELNRKGFYINDGMILTTPNNINIRNILNDENDENDENYCHKLTNYYKENNEKFIVLSNLNFNPINYWESLETLSSEKIDLKTIESSFCVNLFSKTSSILFDNFTTNSFINKIINIGIGKEKFYNFEPIDETINYINLYKRPEKNIFFIATWNRIFKSINRFEGILTKGNINGCGKSHNTIVINSNSDYTIVLEDDAIPSTDFYVNFINILNYSKNNYKNFDFITLASPTLLNKDNKTLYTEKINNDLIRINNCSSSHFIIYSKTILPFFEEFYHKLNDNKIKETNHDWYFNLNNNIRKLISRKFLSYQYFGFTSDVVSFERENDFFSYGEKQLSNIINILDNKNISFSENLYSFIDKEYILI